VTASAFVESRNLYVVRVINPEDVQPFEPSKQACATSKSRKREARGESIRSADSAPLQIYLHQKGEQVKTVENVCVLGHELTSALARFVNMSFVIEAVHQG
jgi:hypothetical protein